MKDEGRRMKFLTPSPTHPITKKEGEMELPRNGRSQNEIMSQLRAWKEKDVRWQDGKVFSLVYSAGEEAQSVLKEAYNLFFSDNMLNPTAYPSLRRCETEVVA
ncbi:MAG: hypothetical protein ACE5FD_12505, partial [Anaerolineae bacterium]